MNKDDKWEVVTISGPKPELTPAKGTKADNGKVPLTITPREFTEGVASVFSFGARKYGRNNFKQGIEITRTLDAALRHIIAFTDGEDLDPESGLSHLYHAACSLAMTDYNMKHNSHLDDRFKKDQK